ncbi:MAG: hypothetical protein Kow00107_08760 [Planctomycetota bacterium]
MSSVTQMPEVLSKKERQPEKATRKGLCETCLNSPNCCFSVEGDSAVLFCEEFVGYMPVSLEEVEFYENARARAMKTEGPQPCAIGLCADCAKKDNCSLKASSDVIWHCEEYE